MDEVKLQNCSPVVAKTLTNLEDLYSEVGEYRVRHAPAIYVLNRFGSSKTKEFLGSFGEYLDDDTARFVVTEHSGILTPLYRVYISNQKTVDAEDSVSLVYNAQRRSQQLSGQIMNNHPEQFRSLVHIMPHSDATQRALNYFLENYGPDIGLRNTLEDVPGILGLMELDYSRYENITQEWLQAIESNIIENEEDQALGHGRRSGFLLQASAMHQKFSLDQEAIDQIESILIETCESFNESVERYGFTHLASDDFITGEELFHSAVISPAHAVNSLTAIGHGYNISGFRREWENYLQTKEREKTRSEFVTTLPATQIQDRRRGIQQRAKSMISTSEQELRIVSLRIDMLHESIIDAIESDREVDVKILTNKGSSRGERKKMANAVMNELARRTEGGVHEHQLVHARMVIADRRELLISSADLTRDQLADEFNSGIYTKDPRAIEQAIEAFDEMWDSGDKLNPGNR